MSGRGIAAGATVWLLLQCAAAPAGAQDRVAGAGPAASLWSDLKVPGGFAALLHAAGIETALDDWRAVPGVIERFYGGPSLSIPATYERYASALARLQREAALVAPDGQLHLKLATTVRRRADFEDLLETLALSYDRARGQVRLRTGRDDQERVAALTAAGLPMATLVERLNAGETVSLATHHAVAPLPFGDAFWMTRFSPAPPTAALLWAILGDRSSASLYHALLSLDDPTRAAAQRDPRLMAALDRHAEHLPVHARAIRVKDGKVLPAGGEMFAALWEDLVGKRLDRPGDFLNELLATEDGRLAYFYGAIDTLTPAARAFFAGASEPRLNVRQSRFRELYSVFYQATATWRPSERRFTPLAGGPGTVLLDIRFQEDGRLAGPPWRDFWRRLLESTSWTPEPARALGQVDQRRALNPIDLLSLLCPDGSCSQPRADLMQFVQRQTADPALGDLPTLFAAGRTLAAFPALALEIDRMQLNDPGIYTKLAPMAARLDQLSQPARAVSLIQFQSTVALLRRLRATGTPADAVRAHLSTLAALPIDDAGFRGGLLRWLVTSVFESAKTDDPYEATVHALAGAPGRSNAIVEWEGLEYRVDRAGTEARRIREVRTRFAGSELATAWALLGLTERAGAAVGDAAAAASIVKAYEALVAGAGEIGAVSWAGQPLSFDRLFRDTQREIAQALKGARAGDQRRVARVAAPLLWTADIVAADALASLVYAVIIEDPDTPLALSRELPRRHDLFTAAPGALSPGPWSIPVMSGGDGVARHVGGSLLGLEAGVPELTLRRMGVARPDSRANLAPLVREGLQRSAALATVWSVADDDIESAVDAVHRGRARAGALLLAEVMDEAGIVGPRAGWIRWVLAKGTSDPAAVLRLEHLARLGGWQPETPTLGAAGRVTECLCLQVPPMTWEALGQPPDQQRAATLVVEPMLRVARELRERELPAVLAPGVLVLLVADLIDRAALLHPLDAGGLADSVSRVPTAQFDDYIAAVAARGPLVPAGEGRVP